MKSLRAAKSALSPSALSTLNGLAKPGSAKGELATSQDILGMEERRGAMSKLCNGMLCHHCAVDRIKIQVYRYANESSQKRSQHEADRSFFVVRCEHDGSETCCSEMQMLQEYACRMQASLRMLEEDQRPERKLGEATLPSQSQQRDCRRRMAAGRELQFKSST